MPRALAAVLVVGAVVPPYAMPYAVLHALCAAGAVALLLASRGPDVRRLPLALSGMAGVVVSVRLWAGPPSDARVVLAPLAVAAVVAAMVTVPWRTIPLALLAVVVATMPTTATRTASATTPPLVVKPHVPGTTRVLVLGDPVAASLATGLRDADGVEVVDGTALGCAITSPTCVAVTWVDAVRRVRPDVVAILAGADRAALDVAVTMLAGSRVVLLTLPYGTTDAADTDRTNAVLRAVTGVTVVDLNAALAPEGVYTNEINGIVVRDGDAITAAGVRLVQPWLYRQLRVSAR